jgi:hypothetical protein
MRHTPPLEHHFPHGQFVHRLSEWRAALPPDWVLTDFQYTACGSFCQTMQGER